MVNGPAIYDSAAQFPDRYQWHKQDLALWRVCQRRYYAAVLDGNLHVPGSAVPNANGYCNSNCYRHSNCGSFGDAYSNCYRHSNSYSNRNRNRDSYSNCYRHSNSNSYAYCYSNGDRTPAGFTDAASASDSSASALACSGIWKR